MKAESESKSSSVLYANEVSVRYGESDMLLVFSLDSNGTHMRVAEIVVPKGLRIPVDGRVGRS